MTAVEKAPSWGWLLALHSSSDVLGVALQPMGKPEVSPQMEAFSLGRGLANGLFSAVEAILPATEWRHLARLAVATGPGGFTGTRLTVALARTLSQQLSLPLDGISSFQLVARRLLAGQPVAEPGILFQELPRHGVVAGLYGVDPEHPGGVAELHPPRLYRDEEDLLRALGHHSRHLAEPQLPADAGQLLAFSQEAARRRLAAPWASVVPLYPTSPVRLP